MNINYQTYPSTCQTTTHQTTTQKNSDHLLQRLNDVEENEKLEESAVLYCSLVEHQANELEHSSLQSQNQENVLIDQFTNLLKTASTLGEVVKIINFEGTTLASTGITISAGLMNLFSGNLLTGMSFTAVGLNELKKIIDRHSKTTTANELLGEARTGVAMIKQLEEFQLQNLRSINTQLVNAQEQLVEAQVQLDHIEKLSVEGSADGEIKKQEAYRLTQTAVREQQQAIYDLKAGKEDIENALKLLNDVTGQLESLISFAKEHSLNPQEINNFINQVEEILERLHQAQTRILQSINNSRKGLDLLRTSIKSYTKALEKYNEIGSVMKQALYEIQMKAKMNQISNAEKELVKAKKEVAIATERAETKKEIIEYTDHKLSQLQEQLDNQYGATSVVIGGAIGTVSMSFVSPLFVMPVTAIAIASTHFIRRVSAMATNLLAKHDTVITAHDLDPSLGSNKAVYNDSSTGWGGFMRDLALKVSKKEVVGSKTQGVLGINLGDNSPHLYGFNRNSHSPLGIMDDNDIKKLDNDLRELLKVKKITANQCLQILNSLAQVQSEYGVLCLISPNCLYLRELRSECKRQLE